MTPKILIIDDEPDIRQLLSITANRMGFDSESVDNVSQAYNALQHTAFQLCLTDLKLPDGSGLDIVKKIQGEYQELPVIVITAHGSMDIAVNAMKHGAFDFINKPVDLKHLRSLINNAVALHKPKRETTKIPEIIGQSPEVTLLKENIIKVSRSQAPVFIVGESGSGKELVARAIHSHSSRKDEAFIAVNCGAIPKELMESELFGHIKGSFTGAHQDQKGLFQVANGGTLLLDEIADLPLEMQVKLLRVIQEKRIRPIGGTNEIPIDVRILSATHKNLPEAIQKGIFRSDLYYRINVIEVTVPPLRSRMSDLPLLSDMILERISAQNNRHKKEISEDGVKALATYTYPGNIRELENILERAFALSEGHLITSDNLLFTQQTEIALTNTVEKATVTASKAVSMSISDTHQQGIHYDPSKESIDEYLEGIERHILLELLEKHRWNRTTSAKELGITLRSLRYRLKKLGIDIDKK